MKFFTFYLLLSKSIGHVILNSRDTKKYMVKGVSSTPILQPHNCPLATNIINFWWIDQSKNIHAYIIKGVSYTCIGWKPKLLSPLQNKLLGIRMKYTILSVYVTYQVSSNQILNMW